MSTQTARKIRNKLCLPGGVSGATHRNIAFMSHYRRFRYVFRDARLPKILH
jgi:ABC-type molybdate transport system ATPase subunit